MKYDLSGKWNIKLKDGREKKDGFLPGSLDENHMGDPDKVAKAWHPDVEDREKNAEKMKADDPRIATRLTRNYTYEGEAVFSRTFDEIVRPDRRYFLFAERARALTLKVDGKKAPCVKYSLSAPTVFEVTSLLQKGSHIELISDNTYPGMPYKDITFSSAATDETQTNWNGIIGELFIEEKEKAFISDFRVYPEKDIEDTISGIVEINYREPKDNKKQSSMDYTLEITGDCLEQKAVFSKKLFSDASNTISFGAVEIKREYLCKRWDEEEGNLLRLKATLFVGGGILDEKEITFGLRSFTYDEEGRFTLNGRRIFLRSEANCALFPETGHPPMDTKSWRKIMKTYLSYGVNCVRFHSWCPPKAAFVAADELGMLLQVELPNWNPRDAFGTKQSRAFYENEILQIVKEYANHPSFVMLTLGNELHSDEDGIKHMHRLMELARDIDTTRLYAWGSNNFYGEKGVDSESDFYTSSNSGDDVLRLAVAGNKGLINTTEPNAKRDFSKEIGRIRRQYKKPVFSFEVGQYEILPDMHELEFFKGVTRPDNFLIVRDRQRAAGLSDKEWEKRVNATGELALLCYRQEVETVLRTPEMSGISLLGLQDFTGQGTALVGMLNSHLYPKSYPFALPERFKRFFKSQAVLLLLDKYVYEVGETVRAEVKVANYGKRDLDGSAVYDMTVLNEYCDGKGELYALGEIEGNRKCRAGELTSLGFIEIFLGSKISKPSKCDISVTVDGVKSDYGIWVFPKCDPVCPENVYETETLDDRAKKVLEEGGTVYYSPKSTKEAIPNSIQAQFSTDFWSVGTFPFQEGAMGQLIDKAHPVFEHFPTEEWTTFLWFHMANQRAFILPRYMKTIVAEMDSYVTLRPMAMLFEAKCCGGKLMASSMGLQDLQQFPEARALLQGIYEYMGSDRFNPEEMIEITF